MSAVMATSPTDGALVMVLGSVPSRAATMCLVTAFLDPLTLTCPTRGPLGRMRQASGHRLDHGVRGSAGPRRAADNPCDEPQGGRARRGPTTLWP